MKPESNRRTASRRARQSARQSWIRVALTPLFMGAILFSAAGRLNWYTAWIFIALVILMQIRTILTLQRISPDLLTERTRIRAGTKPWDKETARSMPSSKATPTTPSASAFA